ncbi:MAG: lamin tail domain-containing protein [Verrucomicrobiota bacterium]
MEMRSHRILCIFLALFLIDASGVLRADGPVISEYLTDNAGGALDEDFDSPDWIELLNTSATEVNLEGYFLTDEPDVNKRKWRFPAVTMPAGGYLTVWASNKGRRVAGKPLHTNFQLNGDEDLALVAPDGVTVVHGYTSPLTAPGPDRYPQETNVSYGLKAGTLETAYFKTPTPGRLNGAATSPAGPLITQETHPAEPPAPGAEIKVSARIRAEQGGAAGGGGAGNRISEAVLTYRVMYLTEASVPMHDDGLNGDATANDEVFTGTIPATHGAVAGQMIRWSITAKTTGGTTRRAPQRLLTTAPEYFGTVIADAPLSTSLPVFRRFIQTPSLADSESGTFCSIFYNGEFHDHCRIRIRGNTSRGFPKKSHKIDLPPGSRVPLRSAAAGETEAPQVSELNLNTTYTDKSYLRALMAAEMHGLSGIASPEIFHIHQRQNGAFYSVALCVENVDDTFLEKHGIDTHGAFYKAVGDAGACDFTAAAAFEKKNRLPEGRTDLQSVVTNLGLTGTARETWLFDNVDLPSWVNWHAGSVISQNIDASNKNYYIYRDTLGSREWSVLPWDMDLTFGPDALNTDTMVYKQSAPSTPACASHPLIGARPWQLHAGKFNRMIEAMAKTPRVRQMVARRIRSLNDQFLETNWFSGRMDALAPLLTADVAADHTKWGVNSHFSWSGTTAHTLAQSITRIKTLYLANRATYLTGTTGTNHGVPFSLNFTSGAGSLGVPAAQAAEVKIDFGAVESNPAGGNQDQEFIELRNPHDFDADLSGWTLEGGVKFHFTGGTVLPAGQSLYVTPDRHAFRQRTVSPRGTERLFVSGPYSGHLNNLGETLTLKNAAGTVVSTISTPAAPSDAQRFLAISEINYNPPGAGDDTEFLEFVNLSDAVALDLTGVKITSGLTGTDALGAPVYFTFAAGTSLAPGARLLVVRSLPAFQTAWPAIPAPRIAGTFPEGTALDNGGEKLKVEDATGSTVMEFTYGDAFPWSALADGDGYSLVHMNPASGGAHPSDASNWRPSVAMGGNPGTSDALPSLTNPDDDDDHDGLSNLLEYVMGENATLSATAQPGNGARLSWTRRPGSDGGRVVIERSADLKSWQPVPEWVDPTETLTGGMLHYEATDPPPQTRQYYRARVQP